MRWRGPCLWRRSSLQSGSGVREGLETVFDGVMVESFRQIFSEMVLDIWLYIYMYICIYLLFSWEFSSIVLNGQFFKCFCFSCFRWRWQCFSWFCWTTEIYTLEGMTAWVEVSVFVSTKQNGGYGQGEENPLRRFKYIYIYTYIHHDVRLSFWNGDHDDWRLWWWWWWWRRCFQVSQKPVLKVIIQPSYPTMYQV